MMYEDIEERDVVLDYKPQILLWDRVLNKRIMLSAIN